MIANRRSLYTTIAFLLLTWLPLAHPTYSSAESQSEIMVDAVLASVDGKPITLMEVCSRLSPPRRLALKDIPLDLEARRILDGMIMESLIESEAENRKLKAANEEINSYLEEVARRNQLSLEGFEREFKKQGGNWDAYKQNVKIQILRQRIIGQLLHTVPGVNSKEIDQYLEEHPELTKSGAKIGLRQIFVSLNGRNDELAKARIEDAKARVKEGGAFSSVAKEYSDSPDAAEGGSLGVVAEGDLSPAVFDAVFPLKDEEVSEIVSAPDGYRIFFVEKRYKDASESDQALRAEVQKILEKQKQEVRVANFFETEILKLHAVDRKI